MNNRTSHKRRSPTLQEYVNSDLFDDEPALKHMKTWFKDMPLSEDSSDEQSYQAVVSGEEFPSFLSSMAHASAAATASITAAAAAVFTPTPSPIVPVVIANQETETEEETEESSEDETPKNNPRTVRTSTPSSRVRIQFTYKLLYILQDIKISSLDLPSLEALLTSVNTLLSSINLAIKAFRNPDFVASDNNSLNLAIERITFQNVAGALAKYSNDLANVTQLLDLLSAALTEKEYLAALCIFKKQKFISSYNIRLHKNNDPSLDVDIRALLQKIKNLVTHQITLVKDSTSTANTYEAAAAATSTANNTVVNQDEEDNDSEIEMPSIQKSRSALVRAAIRLKFKLAYVLNDIKIPSLDLSSLKALLTSIDRLISVSGEDTTFSAYLSNGNDSLSRIFSTFTHGGRSHLKKVYKFAENIANVTQFLDDLSSALTDVNSRSDALLLFKTHDFRPAYCVDLNKNNDNNEICDLNSLLAEIKKLVTAEINLRETQDHLNTDGVTQTTSAVSQSRDTHTAIAALLSLSLFRPRQANTQQTTAVQIDGLSLRK